MLGWTIYISFLGALVLALVPKGNVAAARIIALLSAVAGFAIALTGALQYRPGEILTVTQVPWVPSLGIEYHLAADGISLVLLLLTGIAAVAGILFSWNIEQRTAQFFQFYLVLIGAVYGVFLSFDLLLLFVFYEIAIIPKYFLIAIWGSTRREYGAMKLALYSFAGSAMVLIGMVAAFVVAGGRTMNLIELAKFPFPLHFQMWAFPLVFVGFAILAGMWPFHTWAPTGHVAAPTGASMLLAGVVMKLGAYGCLRVAMMLFPRGLEPWGFHVLGFGSWRDLFSVLAVIGIIYGATVALVQKDFKFVIGYSSVSHMGFVLLGLMTLNQIGLDGAVLQMFSHGVIAGLLFAVAGRMVYDRTHTRDLSLLGPMRLSHLLPFAAVVFVIASMASIGIPGFSGFIAEFEVIVGAWRAFPTLAVLAGVGVLIGIAFTWRAMDKAFFSESGPTASAHGEAWPPISMAERAGAVILLAATLAVGLYPRLLLDLIVPSFHSPLFAPLFGGLLKGGLR
jgi:NADH-quinone oxidoreductase subunit M